MGWVQEKDKAHVLCEATYPFAVDRQEKTAAKMYTQAARSEHVALW